MSDDPTDSDAESETDATPGDDAGGVSPVLKSSLLWGVVGGLSFLVLAQGYELVGSGRITVGVKVGVAVVVAVGATVLTYVTQRRLAPANESA